MKTGSRDKYIEEKYINIELTGLKYICQRYTIYSQYDVFPIVEISDCDDYRVFARIRKRNRYK